MARRDGIYKRASDGKYCAPIYVNGKRYIAYGSTRKEALANKETKLKAITAGATQQDRSTVAAFLQRWLADVVQQRNATGTYLSYSDVVRLYITPHIGTERLTDLTPDTIQHMLNTLRAQALAPRTVRYAHAVLRRALHQAVRWHILPTNPATLVDAPRKDKHTVQPLDEAQARQLLAALQGHKYELVCRVALSLGLRRGEVLAIWWQDVNLNTKTIIIRASLKRQQGTLVRSTTKNNDSRTLHLPDVLVDALRTMYSERTRATPYVFTTNRGTPIEPRNLIRDFKQVLVRAGLPSTFRFHDLRHSAATLMLAQGVPQRVIMEILGHKQISTTMDIYGHVLPSMSKDATDKLAELLG